VAALYVDFLPDSGDLAAIRCELAEDDGRTRSPESKAQLALKAETHCTAC